MAERATIGFLVWRTAMRWRTAVDRAVAPFGLTHAQYSVLASLYGLVEAGERPSQRQLADHTGMEVVYVSKLVRALETSGLLRRTADPADARAVRLDLTTHGRAVVTDAVAVVADLLADLTAPLGGLRSARTKQLVASLETLLDAPLPTPRS
jgi:DNA-binding MarR family transcriptional regulator